MSAGIVVPAADVEAFCRRNQIRKLSLFGSVLRKDFRPDSDVDVLVEFGPGCHVTFFDLARMEEEFSPLVGSRRVDMRTAQDLSRYFRAEVVRGAEVQFAQG